MMELNIQIQRPEKKHCKISAFRVRYYEVWSDTADPIKRRSAWIKDRCIGEEHEDKIEMNEKKGMFR